MLGGWGEKALRMNEGCQDYNADSLQTTDIANLWQFCKTELYCELDRIPEPTHHCLRVRCVLHGQHCKRQLTLNLFAWFSRYGTCKCNIVHIKVTDWGEHKHKYAQSWFTHIQQTIKDKSKNFISGSCQSKHNESSSEKKMPPAAQLATGQLLF